MSTAALLTRPPSRSPERGEWLSRKEAAAYLTKRGCPISAKTLANLAANKNKGGGPPFSRFRWTRVAYARPDLDEWARKGASKVA